MKRIRRPRKTKEIIRFWWEIYRELVRNKRLVAELELAEAMEAHKERYRAWGDVTQTTFEAWWVKKRDLFIEQPSVKELSGETIERKPDHLYLAINLKKPYSKLIPKITERITRLQKAKALLQEGKKRKSKRQAQVCYNDDAEIHLPTFREQFRFFKYVYVPERYPRGSYREWGKHQMDSLGAGTKLWRAAAKHYKGKKKPKYLRLSDTPTPTALRNLRRYVQRINTLCERVAHGQFP